MVEQVSQRRLATVMPRISAAGTQHPERASQIRWYSGSSTADSLAKGQRVPWLCGECNYNAAATEVNLAALGIPHDLAAEMAAALPPGHPRTSKSTKGLTANRSPSPRSDRSHSCRSCGGSRLWFASML
jgi:hypothetical protein